MDLSNFSLYKISDKTIIKPFDCGDNDLNSFLQEKAVFYSGELLATTYILESNDSIAAFFSIFNDNIKVEKDDFPTPSAFKRFLKDILSHPKRHLKSLPALKIGRLAVSIDMQRKGIGKIIIDYIKDLSVSMNESCACKFVSVDAYSQSLKFYENIGFEYLTIKDEGDETRQMYLDLTPYINAIKEIETV